MRAPEDVARHDNGAVGRRPAVVTKAILLWASPLPKDRSLRTRRGDSLSPRDRLLATVITLRWSTQRAALASIMGISTTTLARAIRETTLDLTAMGKTIPKAPIKATTSQALRALVGQAPAPGKCSSYFSTRPWERSGVTFHVDAHRRDIGRGDPNRTLGVRHRRVPGGTR